METKLLIDYVETAFTKIRVHITYNFFFYFVLFRIVIYVVNLPTHASLPILSSAIRYAYVSRSIVTVTRWLPTLGTKVFLFQSKISV